jgi:predicted transcriptional regulator
MEIEVQLEPDLFRQLDQLARQLGKSRSACVRDAIAQYLLHHGDGEEARQQSQLLPDWSDWTA